MQPDAPLTRHPLAQDVGAAAFLQSSVVCKDLPEPLLTDLCAAAEVLSYSPGVHVLVQGTRDDALFFILEGSVSICKAQGEQLAEVATLERPALFGETAVLTQQPRSSTVVTRADTRLVRIPGDVVRRLAEASPKLGRLLATLMAARQKDTDRKLGPA